MLRILLEVSDHLAKPSSPQNSITIYVSGKSIATAGPGEIQLHEGFNNL